MAQPSALGSAVVDPAQGWRHGLLLVGGALHRGAANARGLRAAVERDA